MNSSPIVTPCICEAQGVPRAAAVLDFPNDKSQHKAITISSFVQLDDAGAVFVKPEVRPGLLPSILTALVEARSATRAQLKEATDPATRAVLDSRQKVGGGVAWLAG